MKVSLNIGEYPYGIWYDHIRNTEIAECTGLPSLVDLIIRSCNSLFGHMLRKDSPAHQALQCQAGSILSVESNQNMESKTKNVESKTEKCGVQNSIFTSRNQLF